MTIGDPGINSHKTNMTDRSINYQQKHIYYRVSGIGQPVMLVHGFGEDGSIWDNQVALLSTAFQLIIPDLPGSGRSEPISDMSIEGMAEVIQQIWHQETASSKGAEKQGVLIGHSMGGYITLAFAEKYPQYLKGFGLVHSTAFADSEAKIETRRKGMAFIREHGSQAFLKTVTPNLFAPETLEKRPGLIQDLISRGNNFLDDALVLYYDAMIRRPDRTVILKQSAVPVLFVIGVYDGAVPPQDGFKQCHLPEKSYIHALYRSGHMGMLEEPDQLNRILEKYLMDIQSYVPI